MSLLLLDSHLKSKRYWLLGLSDWIMYQGFILDVLFTKGVFGCQGKTPREEGTHLRAYSSNHKGRQDVLTLIKLLAPTQREYKLLVHFKNDLKCKQRVDPLPNGTSLKVENA